MDTSTEGRELAELPELGYDHLSLRTKTVQFQNVEKLIRSVENQRRAMGDDGLPDVALVALDQAVAGLRPIRNALGRDMRAIVKGSPLYEWVVATRGLGSGLVLLVGSMPSLQEFESVAGVWKYCGLDVRDGRAPKGQRGERLGFDPRRRAYAIMRVADPIVKSGGPYRAVYDDRKAHTAETHPDMLGEDGELAHPDCEKCQDAVTATKRHRASRDYQRTRKAPSRDCSAMGGPHWTAGHRHSDALRVTAKAVLRDAYRVVRGQAPRVGSAEDVPHARPGAAEPVEAVA